MYDEQSKGVSPIAGFFILIAFAGAGLVIASIITVVIIATTTGGSIPTSEKEMYSKMGVNTLRATQIISTFFVLFLPAIIVSRMASRKPWAHMGFKGSFNLRQLGLAILIMYCAIFFAGSLAQLNEWIPIPAGWASAFKRLEENYAAGVEAISGSNSIGDYIASIFMIALLPSIFEEAFFRGGLQNFLHRAKLKPWAAILIVSILFSLFHYSYYGFLPRLGLGIVLGLFFYYTKSIWISVIAHFLYNAVGITQLFVLRRSGKSVEEIMNRYYPLWWGFAATLVMIGLFILYRRISARRNDDLNTGTAAINSPSPGTHY